MWRQTAALFASSNSNMLPVKGQNILHGMAQTEVSQAVPACAPRDSMLSAWGSCDIEVVVQRPPSSARCKLVAVC